ncbi:MFS transporter [Nocardia sp. NPDC004568]|uniref:MFS transporter n=1 Tax=Nocardia sp. NPDC004568 TaxID=3154551 RepID=UPI0033A5957D
MPAGLIPRRVRPDTAERLPPDFYRLRGAFTAGRLGSALGAGALPLVAIVLVGASDLPVSLMVAGAGVAAAVIALPLGSKLSTLGGPVGGLLVAVSGTTTTLIIDSLGHLVSALGIRRIRTPETPPAHRNSDRGTAQGIEAGWTYLFAHPTLHRLFWNATLCGGSLVLISPLPALLVLRELGFPPWQYGLVLGLPGLGGLLGSWCAPRLVARFGEHTVLLGAGTLRTCWPGLIVLAGPGPLGLTVLLVAETLLLLCAGVFNPVFAAYRTNHTADDHMVRVGTAWSISAKCVQPAFIALGGVLAAALGVRAAIALAALALPASAAPLPWGGGHGDPRPGPDTGGNRSGLDESGADGVTGQRQPIT